MKKSFLLIIYIFLAVNLSHGITLFAADCQDGYVESPDGGSCIKGTLITTTESIPGGQCSCIGADNCTKVETKKYTCIAHTGLTGFQTVFAEIIRYFIYIVLLLGVLGIVGLGIAWAFAGGDDIKAKTSLKTWGVNIIIGLTILFLFSYILRFLAPWVYQ